MKELFQLMAVLNKLRNQLYLTDDRILLYIHSDLTGYVYTQKSERLITLFAFDNQDELIERLKAEIGQVTFNKMIVEMGLEQ